MGTINQVKQQSVSDTPLLLFVCTMPTGDVQRWSTHAIAVGDDLYLPRVLRHDLFDLQLSADDAMDGISQLSLTLANADSMLSELNAAIGFKGSQLTALFSFADLSGGNVTTETMVLFRGVAGDPEEVTELSMTLTFLNKLSLQRSPVPEIRIQRSCPWNFPGSTAQRREAVDGGALGRYSRFFPCGYSPDVRGGSGNSPNGFVFAACDKSRYQCIERGMFDQDEKGNITRRFGGFEFVPSITNVRTSGDKTYHLSPLLTNSAKYNDPVPLVYGTGWLKAPLVFARNDGNLTHMEVILGAGNIQGVLKVVVNDVEIPKAIANLDMTPTGWYSLLTPGGRSGSFNLDFVDANGNPLGDPYGSIAVLSVVVPNRISTGTSVPNVEVLVQGLNVDIYDANGQFERTTFTNNPAWILLDLLRRCGWTPTDLNMSSFASTAAFCAELIQTTDTNGSSLTIPRYACNLVVTRRQSAASVVRGIRVAASLMLRYGASGTLELLPEATLAFQQSTLPDGSNSTTSLNGGWPAYEFSDGSDGFSGLVRAPDGSSSVRITARSIAEISNRLSVEFQDEANEYQQDSLSVVSQDDLTLIGYEISSQSTALGLPNYNQATRVLLRQLDKLTKGNLFIEFQASFQAIKVRPGDIITVTYLKEGFARLPFRVVKLSPSANFQTVLILGQFHNDDWYSDNLAMLEAAGRQPSSQVQIPRPLVGLKPLPDGAAFAERFDFLITEEIQANQDGTAIDTLSVSFSQPTKPANQGVSLPLLNLAPSIDTLIGSLPGGQVYYYAVTANDSSGEGNTSFVVRAQIPTGTTSNTVTLTGLTFPRTAQTFNVYRGLNPQSLYQIESELKLSSTYVDSGLPARPRGLPDSSFDHANFYYRYEYAGPFRVTGASKNLVICEDMGAPNQAYTGMVVRIINGTGTGQERAIAANDEITLTSTQSWTITPDTSSEFVICEASWRFAAVSSSSPAKFQIAYRAGSVLQISGRGANVLNHETSQDLCPLTRIALGEQEPDFGAPAEPTFALNAPGSGELTLSGLGFTDLKNVGSITTGTLQLFYLDELNLSNEFTLSADIGPSEGNLQVSGPILMFAGEVVQVGAELMTILAVNNDSTSCSVLRGAVGSIPSSHSKGEPILRVQKSAMIVPFAQNFFENRASINYLHSFVLPDARVSAAELFVSNSFGDSQAQQQCFTGLPNRGLRTLSGGQFALQATGSVLSQQNAAPPILIEADHAVRDVRGNLGQAAQGYTVVVQLLQSGRNYCSFQINSNTRESAVLDGIDLPALTKLSMLSMNVFLQPVNGFDGLPVPPKDLTVTIRL